MEEKLGNRIFFALNILNETECLVCAQIIRKKCEYLLKRHYRTRHSACHYLINSFKESAGCIENEKFKNSGI